MDDLGFESSLLAQVRDLAHANSLFAKAIGNVAQFRLIIDANFVISDLLHRIRYPERSTAVEELIRCTVFVVVAPAWLETELRDSALPQTAERRGIPLEQLKAQWLEYRKLLVWDEAIPPTDATDVAVVDPKDVPYVATQLKHDACGVLSKDPHIAKLGGTRLSFDFVLSARSYARTVVVSVGIRVSGTMLAMVTVGAMIEGVKAVAALFSKLPPVVQAVLVATVIVALLDPKSRAWIFKNLSRLFEVSAPFLMAVTEVITKGKDMADNKEAAAAILLADTRRYISEAAAQAVVAPVPAKGEPA